MTAFFLIMIFFGNMCLLIALIMHVEQKGSVRKKPTKKGITIRLEKVDELIAALTKISQKEEETA